jgi:hypothetical protein
MRLIELLSRPANVPMGAESGLTDLVVSFRALPGAGLESREYEARDGKGRRVGRLRVRGVVLSDIDIDTRSRLGPWRIATQLLRAVCSSADRSGAVLSAPGDDPEMVRFMEKFGFRSLGDGTMERMAGSAIPMDAVP